MSLDALTGNLTISSQWNAQKNVSGFANPNSNQNSDQKQSQWTALGGGAKQCNIISTQLLSIAASGTSTIDLTSLTDVLGGTANTMATLKGFKAQLVSVADDSVNGTACSQVTIGNSSSNAHPLDMGDGTLALTDMACANSTTLTSATGSFTAAMVNRTVYITAGTNFTAGRYTITAFTNATTVTLDRNPTNGSNATAGVGSVLDTSVRTLKNGEATAWASEAANGRTVDSTHKNVLVTNNDAVVAAKVRVVLWGD